MAFLVDPSESQFPNTDTFPFSFPNPSSLWVPGSVLESQASIFSSQTYTSHGKMNYPVFQYVITFSVPRSRPYLGPNL